MQNGSEMHTIGKLLHDKGYYTGYYGKYLNMYGVPLTGGTKHVPPGWDEWQFSR